MATATMAIWYLPGPAELNLELTLWQILATAIGALVTLLVEVVFRYFSPRDPVVDGLTSRLQSIEEMLNAYGGHSSPLDRASAPITQYAMSGTSMLRQYTARRNGHTRFDYAKINTIIALVGRAIDICAALMSGGQAVPLALRERAQQLKSRVTAIRESIQTAGVFEEDSRQGVADPNLVLFSELEAALALLGSVLAMSAPSPPGSAAPEQPRLRIRLFVADAFSNPDYLRFALAGTAASMLCYVIYVGLNWPGISTAVTTCALTALSDIGSSRQKQLLRIGGAALGGFGFGVGSQIFILPYIDSIVGLTLLFAVVTGLSAYVATSSPRLSYAGLQMAFAFYLINVMDFSISLDLTVGRDRAVGVLLGIASMWLVFERLYPRPAAIQMVRQFARSARLVASLTSVSASESSAERVLTLRDEIARSLGSVNAEADAVLFESGEKRLVYLAARNRVRRWLSTLRTLYLLDLPLLPFSPIEEYNQISPLDPRAEAHSADSWSRPLIRIAESLENQLSAQEKSHGNPSNPMLQDHLPKSPGQLSQLVRDLERDVLREPVFSPEHPALHAV